MSKELCVKYSFNGVLAGALFSVIVSSLLTGCAGKPEQPANVTRARAELAACPASPNCVSTEEQSAIHRLDAPTLKVSPEQAWPAVIAAVAALPRATLTYQNQYHLRAEFRSWLFRFTDDVEIYVDTVNNRLAMRSASRFGYSDLGVNARRLENLITELRSQGIIE